MYAFAPAARESQSQHRAEIAGMLAARRATEFLDHGIIHQVSSAWQRRQKPASTRDSGEPAHFVSGVGERGANQPRAVVGLRKRGSAAELLQVHIAVQD